MDRTRKDVKILNKEIREKNGFEENARNILKLYEEDKEMLIKWNLIRSENREARENREHWERQEENEREK